MFLTLMVQVHLLLVRLGIQVHVERVLVYRPAYRIHLKVGFHRLHARMIIC